LPYTRKCKEYLCMFGGLMFRFILRRNRLLLAIFLVAALAFSVLAVAPPARSAKDEIAPAVIDTAPLEGQEMPLRDAQITFLFNQPMDQASVQDSFRATAADGAGVTGNFSWDAAGEVLIFAPFGELTRGAEYRFEIGETAKARNGLAMKGPFKLALKSIGFLEVVQIIPADNTRDIEAKAAITVIFNRPVVPLTPLEEQGTLPNPIEITPATTGTGMWINTSIYQFKADNLTGGSNYTVRVPAGLTDVTGAVLAKDVTASFSTISPSIIYIDVARFRDGGALLRDDAFMVTFSQPMDRESTERAIKLTSGADRDLPPLTGSFTWNERNTVTTFKPDALLGYDTRYTLAVDATIARSTSGAQLGGDVKPVQFARTVAEPAFIGFGDLRDGYVSVNFAGAIKFGTDFETRLTISPKPARVFDSYYEDGNSQYTYSFSAEPDTEYTVTINLDGLTDIYGTPVKAADSNLTATWRTGNYDPAAQLQAPISGLYSAYNPVTRLFFTHRNIDYVNLALYSVSLDAFLMRQVSGDQPVGQPLRSWAVQVENPKNVLRYDMLHISDQGPSTEAIQLTCSGAPPTRLDVGDEAIVLPDDPQPINVRQRPSLDAEVVLKAPVNTPMAIIDGPICADKFVWWQVRLNNDTTTGWVAEGTPQSYFIGKPGSTAKVEAISEVTPLKPDAESAPLKPGIYQLRYRAPQIRYGQSTHLMLVATANVVLKQTPFQSMAWVTDLKTGQPIAGVEVNFTNISGYGESAGPLPLGTATTNADGIAMISYETPQDSIFGNSVAAVVQSGETFGIGMAAWQWEDGISPYDFDQSMSGDAQTTTAYTYTDRVLYRPGQPVYFRGFVRARRDATYTMVDAQQVRVIIRDSQNQRISDTVLDLTPFGTFNGSFQLDAGASLGFYLIDVRLADGDPEAPPLFVKGFSVAQYRVPEYQVKVTPEATQVVQGDTIKVTVDGTFFFGGALSGAKVTWNAYSEDYFFDYKGQGSYRFFEYNEDEGYRENYRPYDQSTANGEGLTDERGQFVITLPADLGKAKQSQSYTIEATITDESGQAISARTNVVVNQGEYYLGAGTKEYIGRADKENTVNVISVNPDNTIRAGADVAIRIVERRWKSVRTVDQETGRTIWNYDVEELPITDGEIRTDDQGKATFNFTPTQGGIYKIYATSRDGRGNQITTTTFAWVAGPNYIPWRQQNSNRIELRMDRSSYRVGDTASILIASPFQGEVKALISIERGDFIKHEMITLTTNSTIYELPITADLAPNAYVSVVLMKGVDETNPVAAFRVGLAAFSVDIEQLKLNLEITPDKPQAGPREEVTYTIKVTNYLGEPVQAEVGLGLTDLAVLSLRPDTSPGLLQYLYSEKLISVRTGSSLAISVDQQTQEILNTVKGGGGGGPEGGIPEVRQLFVDTPLWSPGVVTDAQGIAKVTVTLPDNLTTWRLDARAITLPQGPTNTTLVGQNTFDLISTKPLLIRPVTPRFFTVGDKGELVAIVNNNTGADQEVTARIQVTGVELGAPDTQVVKIAAGERHRFSWPVTVLDVPEVDVTFFTNNADNTFSDAAKSAVGQGENKTLPVIKFEVPEVIGTAGTLGGDALSTTEGIVLPRRFNATNGTLSISLDRSLAASTVDALEVLRNFPHQCVEQTVSRFLPNVATYGAFSKLGVQDPVLQQETETALLGAIQILYANQGVDGGWGWFLGYDSNAMVTAYALVGLAEAQGQGFTIDERVISAAVRFLQGELSKLTINTTTSVWQLNRQAFLLYALAVADAGNYARAVSLFDVREKLSIFARAYLAMAFRLMDQQSQAYTDPLVSDLNNRVILSATGAHWEEDFNDRWNWNTNTRTTSIAMKALILLQPDNKLIPQIVRWLMIARTADAWETTQETAWAVMALVDWMQVTNELQPTYTFSAALNEQAITDQQTADQNNVRDSLKLQVDLKDLLQGQLNALQIARSDGPGMLYYTARLRVYLPVDQIQPISKGITVSRQYSLLDDPTNKPITSAAIGQNVKVTVTIIVPSTVHYIQVTDPLPAGAEGVDPQLKTSAIGQQPELNTEDPMRWGWGWWWFSETEFRDKEVVLYAEYLPAGTYNFTYVMRPGLAGAYNVIPTTAQEFYTPEVYGRGAGSVFTIQPAP
jgi:alpha-2-macroglobulin